MLLITADDRTGALEVGGACAAQGFNVCFAPKPTSQSDCALQDLGSRHVRPAEAARRMVAAHVRAARFRGHKMDSGLRGNWAFEVAALLALGHRVGVVASFPDAGRRCAGGSVFIRDVPLLETPFGRDPRSRLISNRPADYLRAAGCAAALAAGRVVVLDANDNAQLAAVAARCLAEQRLPVGTTGAIAAYTSALRAGALRPPSVKQPSAKPLLPLPRPALVVCGSLHPLSRTQVGALKCEVAGLDDCASAIRSLRGGADVVLATPLTERITDVAAQAMSANLARAAWDWLRRSGTPTLIVLGGDTTAAILGERPLRVLGNVAVGVPLSRVDAGSSAGGGPVHVVTKGGGIGEADTLTQLLPCG